MTVETPGTAGADVVPYDESMVGLEDIGIGDVVIPRLQIQHTDAVFEDNLSKARYEKLKVIILGLVKQRIHWDDDVDEGDKPKCKSPDFDHGFPNVREDVKIEKRFPWDKSNFNPEDFPADQGLNGLVTLPCNSCIFKEWDKGDWKQPPCNEQHTYPVLYSPDDGDTWTPALFTTQRTGIKPSRQYMSSFAQSKTPMFTVYTELSLTAQSRGSVKYAVPVLKRLEATDRDNWSEYANQYRSIRDFVRSAPRRQDEEEEGTVASPTTPASAAAPVAAAPSSAPAASSTPSATTAPAAATTAPASPNATTTPATPSPETPTAAAVTTAPASDDDLPF